MLAHIWCCLAVPTLSELAHRPFGLEFLSSGAPASQPLSTHLRHPLPPSSAHKMSLAASRAVLRHSTFAVRRAGIRNASSTSDAASAAKEKAAQAASTAQSKASEGLSRVTSSAGSALSKAGGIASGAVNTLANAGGRTGRLIGRIQCQYTQLKDQERVNWDCTKPLNLVGVSGIVCCPMQCLEMLCGSFTCRVSDTRIQSAHRLNGSNHQRTHHRTGTVG
jgi:hypothetical protein